MEIKEQIAGAEKLTAVFGYWPDFHDAEVHSIRMHRDQAGSGLGTILEALIKTEERTDEVAPEGHWVMRNHVLVLLRFQGVNELRLDGFNHQNALLEIGISERPADRVRFDVHFVAAHGVEATFLCRAIECASVTPCDATGNPLPASAES